ncbi:hypothetical protein ACFXCU_07340 [Streptomyces virginiae]|uniref:hypothetical protein n=1 Tax=Streptomyces virginiae TaxID=1961 RepID=UPI0036BF7129
MRTTAPALEELLDHRGNLRARSATGLTHEQSHLGFAFHEAGHAVLAMAHGMHVLNSEVIAWISAPGQSTITGRTSFTAWPQDIHPWRFAAQAAAGQIAQVHYLMTYGLWTPQRAVHCAADHDREQAIDVLASCGHRLGRDHVPEGGKSWGMVRGMARRKVCHLWDEIRTVAHAMHERSLLTGDEIATLTGMTNPPAPGGAS